MDRGLLTVGAVPLAAGVLVPVGPVLDGPAACPFRALTGLPCPLCGATRAFVLFGHADGRWASYGAVWVLAALAAVALGLTGRRPRTLPAVVATVLVAWAWALAHTATITSTDT